ncbi:unnamed protein product [Gadus morhua 'NCC']
MARRIKVRRQWKVKENGERDGVAGRDRMVSRRRGLHGTAVYKHCNVYKLDISSRVQNVAQCPAATSTIGRPWATS